MLKCALSLKHSIVQDIYTILYNRVFQTCFSMTVPLYTKQGLLRHGLSKLDWKNLTGLHTALTSTQLITFVINWNLAPVPDLTNDLVPVDGQIPTVTMQNLVESLLRYVKLMCGGDEKMCPQTSGFILLIASLKSGHVHESTKPGTFYYIL